MVLGNLAACMLCRFSRVQLFVTPWTVTCQAPLSMGFSRQEYWGGVLFPSVYKIQPVHSKGDQSWVFFRGVMQKLKLPYFGHLMWKVDSLGKTLMLGGIGGRRRRGRHRLDGRMASLTRWTWVWVNSGSWWWTGRPGVLQCMGSQTVRHDWATELNWSWYQTGI